MCMVLGEHMVRGISVLGHAAQIHVQRDYIRMRVQPIGIVAVAAQVLNSTVLCGKGSSRSHSLGLPAQHTTSYPLNGMYVCMHA